MAGSMSDYLEDEILDHVLKTGAFGVPSDIYISLHTGSPGDADDGANEITVKADYVRVVMNSWDAATGRATENTNEITFPQSGEDWGTISHYGIYDAITAGNLLFHGSFEASKTCPNGTNLYIAAGGIDIVFDADGICDGLANEMLDHVLKTTSHTPDTDLYVALFTTSPTDSGVAGTECTGGAYAREGCNGWDASSSGASENTAAITFTTATASWGTVAYFVIMSHLDAEEDITNTLIWGTVNPTKTIGIDDVAEYAIGALDITLD